MDSVLYVLTPTDFARSRQDVVNHVAVDVRQTEVTPRVAVRQFLVIDSEAVKDRRMEVMVVNLALHSGKSEIICRAVDVTSLHATARKKKREAVVVVVPS